MNISVCMIVKNEEAMLEQSLRNLSFYFDDIVVVDTGSTDATLEIARSFTTKVYDFLWCGDFSAARNFSLTKAAYDWVLVLDADEVVIDLNGSDVQNLLNSDCSIVGRIKLINILTESLGEKRTDERVSRLFNRHFFHYEGIIHEQIIPDNGESYRTVPVDVTVEHRGYTQAVIQRTDKAIRNITLLKTALAQRPDDTYFLYQLGKSYYLTKDFQAAADCFARTLESSLNFSLEYAEDLVESYGYALLNSENYSKALCLERYASYYDSSPDYLFLMGLVYMNNGMFSQAIEFFLRCVGNKRGKVEGINSWLPNYNIAVIYECLGYQAEAVHYYKKCENYKAADLALLRIIAYSKN